MRVSLLVAALASAIMAPVQARPVGHHHGHRLPPVAGTIRLAPGISEHASRAVVVRPYGPRWPAPEPQIVVGGLWPAVRSPAYAFASEPVVVRRSLPGQGLAEVRRWAGGGTGLAGMIGRGNPFAGEATWGTADSATTGTGRYDRVWGRPLVGYGEPAVYPPAYALPVDGAAPQLGHYGSGTPYGMAYYSSGSSAGPYGSPGGLATYRSGSYGYGPRVIMIPHGRATGHRRAGGPHVVHLGRRSRAVD